MSDARHHPASASPPPALPAEKSKLTAACAASRAQAGGAQPGSVDSTDLLRGRKMLEISHNGSTYRLQATRLGKLILTK
jgi:hemin uptake protein HemP